MIGYINRSNYYVCLVFQPIKLRLIMRIFLLFSCLLNVFISHAQFDKKIIGPIKTRKGIELKEGDTLLLGRGANHDGTFQYVKTGLMASTAQDPLTADHAHTTAIVKLFRQHTIGKSPKLYASLKAGTIYTAFADVEAAVDAKEIIAINGQEIGKPQARQQTVAENTLTASNKGGPANSSAQGSMTVKPFSNDVDIKILSIDGNKSQQTVTVNFVLKTELPHQKVGLVGYGCNYSHGEGKAYDGDGTEYKLKNVTLGNEIENWGANNKLPTSVPLKGSITFANVLSKVGTMSFVTFFMSSRNYDGGDQCQGGNVEIRNAKIDWK